MYWLMELLPNTKVSAQRLGLVTHKQIIGAVVGAIENRCWGVRIVEVPEIRGSCAYTTVCASVQA